MRAKGQRWRSRGASRAWESKPALFRNGNPPDARSWSRQTPQWPYQNASPQDAHAPSRPTSQWKRRMRAKGQHWRSRRASRAWGLKPALYRNANPRDARSWSRQLWGAHRPLWPNGLRSSGRTSRSPSPDRRSLPFCRRGAAPPGRARAPRSLSGGRPSASRGTAAASAAATLGRRATRNAPGPRLRFHAESRARA